MAGEAAELAFVATMRDEASREAKGVRKVLDSIGGSTKPITTSLDVDASGARAAAAEASAAADGIPPEFRDSGEESGQELERGLLSGIGNLKGKIVGGIAALGIGSAIGSALGMDAANDKLAAGLGAGPKLAKRYGKLSADIYSGAWGESVDDVNNAVASVATSFEGLGSGGKLKDATTAALDYAAIFDVDVTRAANTAGLAVKSGLAKNATEAFDLITAASQAVPVQLREDVLDASDEYGQFFASLGFDGEAAFGVLAAGAEKGMFGIDKAGDAVKEFTIRSTDMSTSSKDAYKSIGLNARTMANDILAGGNTAKGATDKIIDGILGIKDPSRQAEAAIALFGTPLEDLNVKDIPAFLSSLKGAEGGLGKVAGASKRAGDTLNDNATTNLTSFVRQAKILAVDVIGGSVLPAVENLASFLSTNFGPAWEVASDAVGSTVGFLREHETVAKTLGVVLGVLIGLTAAHAAVLAVGAAGGLTAWLMGTRAISAATKVWAAVQWAMNAALLANPIVLAVVALVALVAAIVLAWKKSETFRAVVLAVWAAIKSGTLAAVRAVTAAVGKAWDWIKSATAKVWNAVKSGVSKAWNGIKSAVSKGVSLVKSVVGKGFSLVQKLIVGYVTFWLRIITTVWNGIKSVVSRAVAGVRSAVVSAFNAVKSSISTAMNTAKSIVSRAWAAIKSAVSRSISGLLGVVKNLPGRIKGALGNIGGLLLSAGEDLIRGMITGVGNMAGALVNKAKDVVGGAIKGAKALLGIKSPSRVFKAIGRFTIAGFVKGLVGSKKKVDKAIDVVFGAVGKRARAKLGKGKRAVALTKRVVRSTRDEVRAIRENAAARDKLNGKLKTARTRAADLVKATRELANVTSVDATNDAPLTAGFIAAGLRDRLAAIETFRADLERLRARGVSDSILAELEAKGVEAGGATAAALAAGTDAQLAEIAAAQKAIGAEAAQLGKESVAGVAKGVAAELKQIDKVGRRLARRLRNAIRKELGIRSPSRRTAEDGRDTARGLAAGLLDEARTAERAARTLADRVGAAAVPTLPDLARLANASSSLSPVVRSAEVVTIRHEVVSPDGSVTKLTAEQVANLIARDPKSATKIAAAIRPADRRAVKRTISSSD